MAVAADGRARGLIRMPITGSNSGAPAWVRTIPVPMPIKFIQDHRRLPMSGPLLPSLEFSLIRNPNPVFPSRRLPASMAKSPFEPGRQGREGEV
jgi:hypothetical protein